MSVSWEMMDKSRRFDCAEVYDADGELEGYTLIKRRRPTAWYDHEAPEEHSRVRLGDAVIVNPVECCRTCTWATLENAR